jgi:hypothetical protein
MPKKTSTKAVERTHALNACGRKSRYPRDARNPFRPGAYATCYDILAGHPDGIRRQELVRLLAMEAGIEPRLAEYDIRIIETAGPNDSDQSPRHRSCRDGFWIVRTGDNLKLMVDDERR